MTNTILLADDSVTIQKVIELTFMDEDYEVVAVGNGDEALDRLEEVTPDVVIADVHMPGATGYDVARRAKQLHPQAPVLLLVGTFEPFDEDDFHGSGADAFLKKPFDSQELLQRVSDLMASRAGLAEPAAAPVPPPPAATGSADAGEAMSAPAAAPPPEPRGDATETRVVPTWEEPSQPAAAADTEEPLGTRRMPIFGREEAGDEQPEPWSGWATTGEPEEVETIAPVEDSEPGWPGEAFEPAWESAEAPEREEEPEGETPSWAVGDTEAESAAAEPPTPSAPPPPPAVTTPTPAKASPAASRPHHGDPFPELARPQPAAPAASSATDQGDRSTASPSAEPPLSGAGGGEAPLSAADVDRVARRVAELLGDRVVREVAWEVVPDLAEVVIKDRLRELESQVD